MKSKITPDVLKDMEKHTHDPLIQHVFLLKAYENHSREQCEQFAKDPSLDMIGSCISCQDAKDYLEFYANEFKLYMNYLLQTDRQLKEYMDVLKEMNLTDD